MMYQLYVDGKPASSEMVCSLKGENELFIFESLRSYGDQIFRLDEHVTRLFESARTAGFEIKKSKQALRTEIKKCLSQSGKKDAFIRLGIDRDHTYLIIGERKRPEWIYQKGVVLKTSPTKRNLVHSIPSQPKTNSFLNNVLGLIDVPPHNCLSTKKLGGGEEGERTFFDVIFLDANGFVTEGTIWNIFMVKKALSPASAVLLTPYLGILNGVTRQFVIECAAAEDLPVVEMNLTRHDLWNGDEVFITNTSGEIVPVRSLDGRQIGRQIPGCVTQCLMNRFRMELEKEINLTSLREAL